MISKRLTSSTRLIVLILFAFSIATPVFITGSAVAAVDSAERTINETKATPGDKIKVSINAEFDSSTSNAQIEERIGPPISADSITIINDDDATISAYQESTGTIGGSWGDVNAVNIKYIMKIPTDTSSGDTYEFSGEAEDAAAGEMIQISGDKSIEIVGSSEDSSDSTDSEDSSDSTDSEDSSDSTDSEDSSDSTDSEDSSDSTDSEDSSDSTDSEDSSDSTDSEDSSDSTDSEDSSDSTDSEDSSDSTDSEDSSDSTDSEDSSDSTDSEDSSDSNGEEVVENSTTKDRTEANKETQDGVPGFGIVITTVTFISLFYFAIFDRS